MSEDIPEYGTGVRGTFYHNPETGRFDIYEPPKARTGHHAYITTDEIPPTVSPVDGKTVFTSKKRLFEHYKEHGYECTYGEIHKEAPRYEPNEAEMREDLERIENQLRWGEIPFSEEEREQCRRENEEYRKYKERNNLRR